MCHHYTLKQARNANPNSDLLNEFSVRSNLYQLMLPDAGFYPLDYPPIVRLDESGEREMVAAQWGLLPGWWKPSDKTPKRTTFQRKLFNARSEEIHVKPSYREAFKRRRCLMPADEFSEKGHYFHLPDFRPFALAAIWETWRGGDGEVVQSCTMLTTAANELVAEVGHPRMPVVLASEAECALWLDPEVVERGPLTQLFVPLDSARLLRRPG